MMNIQRADVVLVDYPFSAGGGSKVRPALVIQNDKDNQRLSTTIIVQVTSMTRRAAEPTQALIDITTPDGQQTGLRQPSVVNCVNLMTLDKKMILRKIGAFSSQLMSQVSAGLKTALDMP